MDSKEALAVVESVLKNGRLSKLQRTVFCHAWEEQSYSEIARQSGYELGYVKQTGSQLWQLLSDALDEKVTKHNLQVVLSRCKESTSPLDWQITKPILQLATSELAKPAIASPIRDWGDAVDVPTLFGRTAELTTLTKWIDHDRCRLIGLFGMGGMGKTSLAATLAQTLTQTSTLNTQNFEYVIWRSLRNAPPLTDLLTDLLQVFSNQQATGQATTLEAQLRQLLHYLRRHRCLIILDNGETVMQLGDHGGGYLPGYQGYGQLWRCLGESDHQSAILLTSREKPADFAAIEGQSLPVRSLRLRGLSMDAGQALLSVKGQFTGTEDEWQVLVDHYAGNPLALKMVASAIQDVFDGELGSFLDCLAEGASVFGDIQDLLGQQFNRLSQLEQQVMYWLAIARKPVTLSELRANLVNAMPLGQLLEAMTSLERRYLIDKATPNPGIPQTRFTLQPAVMEYVTECFIGQVCDELSQPAPAAELKLFKRHPLIQAQVKDYVRETQTRLILKPVGDRLLSQCHRAKWETTLRQMLDDLRQPAAQPIGYAGGNTINLLCHLGVDLTGWDFSDLSLWNAYLRGVTLRKVNLSGADLSRTVFTETFSQVLAVAFSPDSSLLATGDVNHEIHLWQVASGQLLLSLTMEEGWVWSVAFSPDGKRLASSANRTVNIWDVQSGACLQTLRGYSDRVFSVAFSPDGQLLATGSEDHCVRIWEVKTGQLLHTLTGHIDQVRSVTFSPSSTRQALVASASYDGTVRLWDAHIGKELQVLDGHLGWVFSVAFSPDGATLASASSDRTVRVWSAATGECDRVLTHSHPVRTVAFNLNGRTLLSGSEDRLLHLWNYRTGECQRMLSGHESWISAIAVSPDGALIASGSEDQSVRLWDSRTHLCLKTLQGYSNGVWSVAYSPDGSLLASGSQDRTVRLWSAKTGELLTSFSGHQSWVWSVAFHPTLPILASSSEDGLIQLWDLATHQQLQLLVGHQDAVLSVVFSPDGQHLLSGSLDGTIRWWNVRTGQCYRCLKEHQGGVWELALSPDGSLLVSGSQDQTVRLWDAHSGECLATLTGHQSWIRSVAISPDRQHILSGSADGTLKLWHAGHCTATLSAHRGPVLAIAVAPDGQTFTTCGTDGWLRQWDLATHQPIHTTEGHQRWVRCATYSPNGTTLATCSQDETIKLWQSSDLTELKTLRIPRPYEGMAIAQVNGLTPAQASTLVMLGAIDS